MLILPNWNNAKTPDFFNFHDCILNKEGLRKDFYDCKWFKSSCYSWNLKFTIIRLY